MKKIYTVIIMMFFLLATSCSQIDVLKPEMVNEPIETTFKTEEKINQQIVESPKTDKDVEEKEESGVVSITFGGDTFMDKIFGEASEYMGVDYPWEEISPIFKMSDIGFVNLETCISDRGKLEKPIDLGFRTSSDKLSGYKNAGINIVSCANNHIGDYGKTALTDTIENVEKNGICCIGAGENSDVAKKAAFVDGNGVRVGFVAYSNIIPNKKWIATEDTPGLSAVTEENLKSVLEDVKAYNDMCDVLVVCVHWGTEHTQVVTDFQEKLGHNLIDNGADLVIGSHPHCLQPIEFYKDKPIFYSTGNLLFLQQNDMAKRTAVFRVEFDKGGYLKGYIYPVYISLCRARLLENDDAKKGEILSNIAEISREYGTGISTIGEISTTDYTDIPLEKYTQIAKDCISPSSKKAED